MALTLSVDTARSSLSATAEQISVVSRNIARVGDPDATRKTGRLVSGPGAGVSVAGIDRSYNPLLLNSYLNSNSNYQSQTAITTALDQIQSTVDETDLERSPAALIAKLNSALQSYSATPQNPAVAATVVSAAKDLATALNSASATVTNVRRQADSDIAASVDNINNLLSQFKDLNNQVVKGASQGGDITDVLDSRDAVLKQLSSEVGIRTVTRDNGDMAIYTDSGVTLFDKSPRQVTFQQTQDLSGGATGGAVYADGVPIAGTDHVMAISSGKLAGLVEVRDEIAPSYQSQLDEIARGLIETFAETDQSATPTLPPAAGLFTYAGGPGVPPSGTCDGGARRIHNRQQKCRSHSRRQRRACQRRRHLQSRQSGIYLQYHRRRFLHRSNSSADVKHRCGAHLRFFDPATAVGFDIIVRKRFGFLARGVTAIGKLRG